NDYDGAKSFVNKAQRLYPNLDGLKQVSMMINVYKSASNGGGDQEADWYKILNVDPLADDEANKFDGAFKLVLDAWCLLSDKVKRASYDQRRKPKEFKTQMQKPSKQQQDGKEYGESSFYRESTSVWPKCRRCKTQFETPKAAPPPKKRTKKASHHQQQQQWTSVGQNKVPNESTQKDTSSERSSVTFTWKCSSVSMIKTSNQTSKRRLEEYVTAEKIPKKART
ncbi:hypothetical protein CARUB_v10007796mg, partial [Capsella rubella]